MCNQDVRCVCYKQGKEHRRYINMCNDTNYNRAYDNGYNAGRASNPPVDYYEELLQCRKRLGVRDEDILRLSKIIAGREKQIVVQARAVRSESDRADRWRTLYRELKDTRTEIEDMLYSWIHELKEECPKSW